ncbi:MAG TPA: hypothetical protein VJK50_04035, partial [Patescibacteria group bacterium]|nr:hypothetical protein [Patescibacteria group bacterium]
MSTTSTAVRITIRVGLVMAVALALTLVLPALVRADDAPATVDDQTLTVDDSASFAIESSETTTAQSTDEIVVTDEPAGELPEVIVGEAIATETEVIVDESAIAEEEAVPADEGTVEGATTGGEGTGVSEQENTESTASEPVANPELSTDKEDYHPGETATIFGRFFAALQNIILKIFGAGPDGNDYTEETQNITTDETGSFTTAYQLDWVYRPLYTVTASTPEGIGLAQTTFTDGPSMGVDKAMYKLEDDIWTTGNAGGTLEGQWVSYQYVIHGTEINEPLPTFKITYP